MGDAISRRVFLTAVGAGSCAALVSSASAFAASRAGAAGLGPEPESLFDDPVAARSLGRKALAEGHPRALAKEVVGLDGPALREATATDLTAGRLLVVGGWRLARTEVAACIHEHLRRR